MGEVSVVIPTYNEERYIKRSIDSLLKQSYKDYELIFVDDGSTDETARIIKSYKSVKLYKHKHVGSPGILRNYGAKKAKGKILVFVDADMQFDENYIKELIKPIRGKIKGTFHGIEKVANLDNPWARCWSIDRQPNPPEYSGVFRAVIKKEFLKANGFKSDKGYFDDDLSHLGLAKCAKGAICYHNNPETLKEVYNHSTWVGKSFAMNKEYIFAYLKQYRYLVAMLIFLATSITVYYLIMRNIADLIIDIFALYLIFILLITLRRMLIEKDYRYLFYMPIFLTVKIIGLVRGFVSNASFSNRK